MNSLLAEIIFINSIDDIKRAQQRAVGKLIRTGLPVGITRECSFGARYATTPNILRGLLPIMRKKIPADVWEREKDEYKEMEEKLVKICMAEFKRDITGRRALYLTSGCISYQHCYLRGATLMHAIHMRGMDTRKFIADLYYMLHATKSVAMHLKGVSFIHVYLTVDCFHRYMRETEVGI